MQSMIYAEPQLDVYDLTAPSIVQQVRPWHRHSETRQHIATTLRRWKRELDAFRGPNGVLRINVTNDVSVERARDYIDHYRRVAKAHGSEASWEQWSLVRTILRKDAQRRIAETPAPPATTRQQWAAELRLARKRYIDIMHVSYADTELNQRIEGKRADRRQYARDLRAKIRLREGRNG